MGSTILKFNYLHCNQTHVLCMGSMRWNIWLPDQVTLVWNWLARSNQQLIYDYIRRTHLTKWVALGPIHPFIFPHMWLGWMNEWMDLWSSVLHCSTNGWMNLIWDVPLKWGIKWEGCVELVHGRFFHAVASVYMVDRLDCCLSMGVARDIGDGCIESVHRHYLI